MQAPSSSQSATRVPLAILGVPFDNVTTDEALELVGEMIATGQPHYGAIVSVDFIVQAVKDVELRRILFDAHLVLANETPIIWASKLLGNSLPERVAGAAMIPPLLALAEHKGWKVFFLGGAEQSLAAAAEKARLRYPQLRLVGAYAPPLKPLLEMNHADILRRIREVKPDILLVALGCPRQEKWINMHYRDTGVPFSMGVGETIDFLDDTFKRGKIWRIGRCARSFCAFIFPVLKQWWRLRTKKPALPGIEAGVMPDTSGNFSIQAPVRLGATEVLSVRAEWLRTVENGHVMLDLSQTLFTDSTGIGLLIRLRKRARELGYQFFLIAPTPPVEAALKMMKLDEFFSIQTSVAGARFLIENLARAPLVASSVQEQELHIRWNGEVTALNAIEVGAYTESELTQAAPGSTVVIDLSRVGFMDSTGIGLLLRFKKNFKRRNITLKVVRPIASVRNVLRHTRLEEYLLGDVK